MPYNPKLKARAAELRKAGYWHEMKLWNRLKNKRFLGLDFDRQKVIGNFIVDFYCTKRKTIIEVDGSSHNYKKEYDAAREEYLKNLGLKVIRIKVRDVFKNLNEVMKKLENEFSNFPFTSEGVAVASGDCRGSPKQRSSAKQKKMIIFTLLTLFLFTLPSTAHSEETSIARYARAERGVLAKEYDLEGGRAYWVNGISVMGLPDAGADVMGFSEPARRLPLGFAGLYTPPPVYERYGLSLNANNGNLIFKENYNPVDTPVTKLLWERYGLDGNAFKLGFNRQLLDSIVFSLGLAASSVPRSGNFYYQDVVHQLYTGTLKRDSTSVPFVGRNLAYDSFHALPAITWIFPHSSITTQMSFLWLNSDDATRDLFTRDDGSSIVFSQNPYNIKGGANFYRLLWNYRFLPNWELSLSHRFAEQDFKFSRLDSMSIYFPSEVTEKYNAQTGESRISHKAFLNPYMNVRYEYLRAPDSSLYQDRQLVGLGINDSLWKVALRGEGGLQRNASAFDSVDWAPAFHLGLTFFLPWHLRLSGDYQKDTRFPDFHETHILRTGRIAFPNKELKAEERQRFETNLTYKLSEHFFYTAGFRREVNEKSIIPSWWLSSDTLPADSAFKWTNARGIENNELFWQIGFELGNWRFYAEQGKVLSRTILTSIPSRYYKGAVYWSNRFVEDRLKVTVQFDADWFGDKWEYALENDSIAHPVLLNKYLSLNFKSSMQIQEFILYAKIENMNHSLMMPAVGYAPPGIRFAYGILWELRN
ncbi:MAG: endonuclease domain-containing protein [Fibromonadaceae bacterium]|nr:endonuclease domain-containing protein [Fibromonadaceae bacterium]